MSEENDVELAKASIRKSIDVRNNIVDKLIEQNEGVPSDPKQVRLMLDVLRDQDTTAGQVVKQQSEDNAAQDNLHMQEQYLALLQGGKISARTPEIIDGEATTLKPDLDLLGSHEISTDEMAPITDDTNHDDFMERNNRIFEERMNKL